MGNKADTPDAKMTQADFKELERLTRKAKYDSSLNLDQHSLATLGSVNIWASRMA